MSTVDLTPQQALSRLVAHVQDLRSATDTRIAIGIAGGPGVGKSTLAGELATMLNAAHPGQAALVPMDGFHMRHAKLAEMGQTDYKGAPHTFEGADFVNFLARLKSAREPVRGPSYSREIEDVIDDAFEVSPAVHILVVEGNYLLLAEPPWSGLRPLLDYAVFLDIPRDIMVSRLMRRHAEAGLYGKERNHAHIERTDLPNYDLVGPSRQRADLVIRLITES